MSAWRVIVVGAGLAGLELAGRLAEQGVDRVLVLEAGPGEDLAHVNASGSADRALRMWLQPETDPHFHQPWRSLTPPHYTGSSGLRRRVGGRGLYWYGVVLPIEPWALADWPGEVVSDLCKSYQDGPGLYDRVLARLGEWCEAGPPERRHGSAEVELAGFGLRGTPRATRAAGAGWEAYTGLESWSQGRPPAGVTVRALSEVDGLIVEDGRCAGVTVGGEQVRGERVVLAAGTLGCSRLVLQACPGTRLTRLTDHMVQGVFVRLEPDAAAKLHAAVPPGSYYAPCEDSLRSNLFLEVEPLDSGETLVDLQLTGEQEPSDASWVECGPATGLTVHAEPTRADLAVIAGQREVLGRVWAELARLAGLRPADLDFGDFADPVRTNSFVLPENLLAAPAGVPMTWSGFIGTEDHEGGTLPLGEVLSAQGEHLGIPGLYACGPVVFPRLGAANPSLTTLALAQRLADLLTGLLARDERRVP